VIHTIRLKLTIWYSAILLAGILLIGVSLWVAVRHQLLSDIDDQLEQKVGGVRAVLEDEGGRGSPEQLREELTEYAHATPGGVLIRVRDQSGQELLPGPPLAEQRAPHRLRLQTERLSIHGQTFEIQVGTDLEAIDRMLTLFRSLLLVAIPFVVSVAFGGGYWISRRALAPVDEITTAAKRISLENLSDRLPVHGGDELQRLSETWNEMLTRLEFNVQRVKKFTADASHELRTPIAVILTTAELTLRRERDPVEYRKSLGEIKTEAERMTSLTENLLMLARVDSDQLRFSFEAIDIEELAGQVVSETVALAHDKDIRLEVKLDGQAGPIRGDRAALRRLLLILLDNAMKYTAAGGSIEVATSRGAGGLVFSVRDTGQGIDPNDLPHVFERFYRADKSRSGSNGTGLGLSIAQSIAQMHGGRIQVESTPGLGCRFDVLIPA
jgi:heavy metal sensor kinase